VLIMRTAGWMPVALCSVACAFLTACSGSSHAPVRLLTGTYAAESGESGPLPAATGDCGLFPEFKVDTGAKEIVAPKYLGPTPLKALQIALTHGSPTGGPDGFGVVGAGYPSAGWTEVAASSDNATFQAPLSGGTAKLNFSRVGQQQWMLTEAQKNC
jgi:hypothetical protein